jgi:hypothetical protein
VYRAAFSLEDRHKYRYPKSKLALHELYARRLPSSVVNRKKSGTVIPLRYYLLNFSPRKFVFAPLYDSDLFRERYIHKIMTRWEERDWRRSPYALVTLSEWLKQNAATAALEARAADVAERSADVVAP